MVADISTIVSIAERALKMYSAVKTLNLEGVVKDGSDDPVQMADDYLAGDNVDILKKVVLVAAKAYFKKKGEETNSIRLSSLVDDAIEFIKAAYDVGTGKMDANIAADKLLDRVSVRAIAVLENAIDKGIPLITEKLCTILVEAYPPAAPLVPIIKMVSLKLTPKLKDAVKKGVPKLVKAAKPFVAKGIQALNQSVRRISSRIRQLATAK